MPSLKLLLLASPSPAHISTPSLPPFLHQGLDSVMGELICLLLKTIALRPPQRLVIMSIHSPPPRIYMLFSHVTLLTSKGELAYWGPRDKLLPFLEGLGYRRPPNYNFADFLLELASTKKIIEGKALALAEDSLASHERTLPTPLDGPLLVESQSSPCLVAACQQLLSQEFFVIPVDDNHKSVLLGVKGARSSAWVSFKTNLWRSWLSHRREYLGFAVGVCMHAGLGLIFGVLYFHQLHHDKGRNTAGYLFSLLVALLSASAIAVCLNFPLDSAILMREYYSGTSFLPPSLKFIIPPPFFPPSLNLFLPPSLLFPHRSQHPRGLFPWSDPWRCPSFLVLTDYRGRPLFYGGARARCWSFWEVLPGVFHHELRSAVSRVLGVFLLRESAGGALDSPFAHYAHDSFFRNALRAKFRPA